MTIAGRANSPRLIVIETGLRQHVDKSRAFVEQIIWDRGMSVPPSACVPHPTLGEALAARGMFHLAVWSKASTGFNLELR